MRPCKDHEEGGADEDLVSDEELNRLEEDLDDVLQTRVGGRDAKENHEEENEESKGHRANSAAAMRQATVCGVCPMHRKLVPPSS